MVIVLRRICCKIDCHGTWVETKHNTIQAARALAACIAMPQEDVATSILRPVTTTFCLSLMDMCAKKM